MFFSFHPLKALRNLTPRDDDDDANFMNAISRCGPPSLSVANLVSGCSLHPFRGICMHNEMDRERVYFRPSFEANSALHRDHRLIREECHCLAAAVDHGARLRYAQS